MASWTCPFCALNCDHLGLRVAADAAPLALQGGSCERAERRLGSFGSSQPAAAEARRHGQPCSLDDAIAGAARLLAASRQPLFAGLHTDVAGARALYPLACALGAICDGDAALLPTLRATQDRGLFTTTLAEVRTRADLIVFIDGLPLAEAPLIRERLGIGEPLVAARHVVVLGPRAGDEAVLAGWAGAGVSVQAEPLHGDLFDTLALLAAGRLPGLNDRLRAARCAVLVGTPSRLPRNGELLVEAVNHLVSELNRSTRAAALWLGASTANAVFTWLSGLPLRTRCSAGALAHEPVLFDSGRLLAEGSVDALVWVSAFDALPPPETSVPTVWLGAPGLAARGAEADSAARTDRPGRVFIPVATPGIGAAGHVFRTDDAVLVPLRAVRAESLPTVADIATRLLAAVKAGAS